MFDICKLDTEKYCVYLNPWNDNLKLFETYLGTDGIKFRTYNGVDDYDGIMYTFNSKADLKVAEDLVEAI